MFKNLFLYGFFFFNRSFIEGEDDDEELEQKQAPLCLNSDISYFGVGGKQAVFFIGNSTRVWICQHKVKLFSGAELSRLFLSNAKANKSYQRFLTFIYNKVYIYERYIWPLIKQIINSKLLYPFLVINVFRKVLETRRHFHIHLLTYKHKLVV